MKQNRLFGCTPHLTFSGMFTLITTDGFQSVMAFHTACQLRHMYECDPLPNYHLLS